MKIVNKNNNNILADNAVLANTPLSRMVGLLGKEKLCNGQALILDPCNSIHTFFMRFPIDVLFLDKNNRVVKAVYSVKAFRLTPIYFRAKLAVELPPGTIIATSTQEGNILSFIN